MIPRELEGLRRFLPMELKVVLETGSSQKQGMIMRSGKKITQAGKYKESAAVCFLNREDMRRLGLGERGRVRVKTSVGEIALFAEKGDNPAGVIFVPKGPWINSVIDADTMQTGSPEFKGMDASVRATDGEVPDLNELLRIYRRDDAKS